MGCARHGEQWREEAAGVGLANGGDLLGGARGDNQAAFVSALGAEVDQAVGAFDHVKVVLDHDN